MLKKILTLLLLISAILPTMAAEDVTPDEILVYKNTPQRDLEMHIFYPDDQKKGKNRPVIISFFGGGWVSGSPKQFYGQSEYFASLGMVAIAADYRLINTDKTTPFEAVMDAKSAVRWVRKNHKKLGIDPNRIVTSGGSAGGHVAACTALIEGVEDDAKLKVSSVPNAMILFNPVINTTKAGYGAGKLVGRETELSPVHHVRPNLPPTIIMHGTQDTTVPYQNAVEFAQKMNECGNQCTLISAFGEKHGFFNGTFRPQFGLRNFHRTLYESAVFLADLGFISKDKITKEKEPIRVACVGNSITFGARVEEREKNSYPMVLQGLLGEDYEVKNFGKSGATLMESGNIPYSKTSEYKAMVEFEPDVIIVKLGTNDSKAKNWVNKEHFVEDYKALIKSIKSAYKSRTPEIYICSPMPSFTGSETESINGGIIEDEIYPLTREVAKESKLVFIDLHETFKDSPSVFPDKIHPNADGAKKMATYIHGVIAGEDVVTKKVGRDLVR